MIVVETERLVVRHVSVDDAGFMLELLNDPAFLRFVGDKGVRTLEDARRYIREGPIESYRRDGFGLYLAVLKEGGTPVGVCSLMKRPALTHPDLGFAFLPAYRSQGYAFESASAVMTYAREALGMRRLLAIVSPDNDASVSLLGKLGLKFERMVQMPGEERPIKLFASDDERADLTVAHAAAD